MKNLNLSIHTIKNKYSSTEIRNRVYDIEQKKRNEKLNDSIIDQYSPKLLEKYECN
jgi:hypothetical protein